MLSAIDIVFFVLMMNFSYFTIFYLSLWFQNKSQREKINFGKNLPKVSVLVPAYNEEATLAETLESIRQINYPKNKLEMVVIDDGSTDETYQIAKKYASGNVKVLSKKNGGKAEALNFGLARARGEFVAVCDADTVLDKNALKNCIKYFSENKVGAVTSHILVRNKKGLFGRLQNIELMVVSIMRKAQEQMNIVSATPGPLSVYRKDALLKLGGFDEKNLVEDVEIAWRLIAGGYKIRVAFDAYAYSIYPNRLKAWWNQRVRWGIGGLQTTIKYFGTMFKKKSFGVGNFLVPTSLLGYSNAFIWVLLLAYLSLSSLLNYSSFVIGSFENGVNPLKRFELLYDVDIKLIYGVSMLLLSLVVLKIVLGTHKEKASLIDMLIFLAAYSLLFSPINLYSFYKFVKGERGWLTK